MRRTIFLLILFPLYLLAEEVTTPTPLPSPTVVGVVIPEFLKLRLELAESEFARNASIENKSELLDIYEKILNRNCLTQYFSKIQGTARKPTVACSDLIEKILLIDPGNAPAICARDGLLGRSCTDAYHGQHAGNFPFLAKAGISQYAPQNQKKQALAADQAKLAEIKNIESAASSLHSSYIKKPEADTKKKLLSTMDRLLRLTCRFSYSSYQQGKENGRLVRTRNISDLCAKYIKATLKVEPGFPLALCQFHGPYSPQCFVAGKKYKDGQQKSDNSPHSDDKPFQEF